MLETVKLLEFGRNNEKCTPTASCPLYVYVHILHKYMSILEHVQIHKTCVYNLYIYLSLYIWLNWKWEHSFLKTFFPGKEKIEGLAVAFPNHHTDRSVNEGTLWQFDSNAI